MSDLDKNKLPPERLTLSGIRNALILSCCLPILFVVMGLVELKHGTKIYAGGFCLAALGQLFNVPQRWKEYRLVKQGTEVYAPAQAETAPLTLVPKTISVTVVLILSGFVGIASIVVVAAAHSIFNTAARWLVAIGILSLLWLPLPTAGIASLPVSRRSSRCWFKNSRKVFDLRPRSFLLRKITKIDIFCYWR